MATRFRVKSQLSYVEKGGILDDCGPCSAAAAVSWAYKYEKDFSGADGIAAKERATGFKEKQGVSDNGSSLSELAKTAKELAPVRAEYASSWAEVITAGKAGSAIIMNVQAPHGYPKQAISVWNNKWASYWQKKDPKVVKEGYGHMTCAAYDAEFGWQYADPTMTGKGPETHGALISEADLKSIAASKGDAPFKRCLIITKK
jgi:hypothetical protein